LPDSEEADEEHQEECEDIDLIGTRSVRDALMPQVADKTFDSVPMESMDMDNSGEV